VRSTAQLEKKIESLDTLLSAQGVVQKTDQLTPPKSQGQSEPSPVDLTIRDIRGSTPATVTPKTTDLLCDAAVSNQLLSLTSEKVLLPISLRMQSYLISM